MYILLDRTLCIVCDIVFIFQLFSLTLCTHPFSFHPRRFRVFALFYLYFPFWLILGIIAVYSYKHLFAPDFLHSLFSYVRFISRIRTSPINLPEPLVLFTSSECKKSCFFSPFLFSPYFYCFDLLFSRVLMKKRKMKQGKNINFSFAFYNFLFGCIRCFFLVICSILCFYFVGNVIISLVICFFSAFFLCIQETNFISGRISDFVWCATKFCILFWFSSGVGLNVSVGRLNEITSFSFP